MALTSHTPVKLRVWVRKSRQLRFPDQFLGKHVLENGIVALGVEKHGKVAKPDYQVDGISGGTITSKGVDAMIKDCLSMYNSFLTK